MADKILPLSNFSELNYDVLYQDLRVFIQGVEVTTDIIGSLSVTWELSPGNNQATFELDNALDKYTITDINIPLGKSQEDAVFGVDGAARYSEANKRDIFSYKTGKRAKTLDADKGLFVRETLTHFITNINALDPTVGRLLTDSDIKDILT